MSAVLFCLGFNVHFLDVNDSGDVLILYECYGIQMEVKWQHAAWSKAYTQVIKFGMMCFPRWAILTAPQYLLYIY